MPQAAPDAEAQLHRLLTHLEDRLDPARFDEIDARYRRALAFEPVDRLPITFRFPYPEDAPFQPYPHRELFTDPAKMLYNELVYAFGTSIALQPEVGHDLPVTVRANLGTVVMASMFAADVEQVEDNPPWIPTHDPDCLAKVVAQGRVGFDAGWCPLAEGMMRAFAAYLADYPSLRRLVHVVLPDLQSPFDTLELLRGSDLYYDLYDQPDLVRQAMAVLAQAQVDVAQHLLPLTRNEAPGLAHQHAMMTAGNILLRNDSCSLIAPEMYAEHVAPHDARVLEGLGGGGLHSCGRCDDLFEAALNTVPGIASLDFGQPEMNDADRVYDKARERRAPLLRLNFSQEQLVSGEVARRFPTGATLVHDAASVSDAQRVMAALKRV